MIEKNRPCAPSLYRQEHSLRQHHQVRVKPISTSSRETGSSPASAFSSTVAPTLEPQPPQRMAMADISLIASLSTNPRGISCRTSPSMSGSRLNLCMKRRSIQSFQIHTQRPSSAHQEREAMAYLSPVEIRLRKFCLREKGFKRPAQQLAPDIQ